MDDFTDVSDFLRRLAASKATRRGRVAAEAPIERIQAAASQHADPFIRRDCLAFLDHYANDRSSHVFARSLSDPVDFVRNLALHSVACERCRDDDLCARDVVPHLSTVIASDPSAELRHKAIPILMRLADREPAARAAVASAAQSDPDELVRHVASRALEGKHIRARKSYRGRR